MSKVKKIELNNFHYPLNIVVARVNKWINGCNEMVEIESCESYIERYILPRRKEPNFHSYLRILIQSLQITRMEIQDGLNPKSSTYKPLKSKP